MEAKTKFSTVQNKYFRCIYGKQNTCHLIMSTHIYEKWFTAPIGTNFYHLFTFFNVFAADLVDDNIMFSFLTDTRIISLEN